MRFTPGQIAEIRSLRGSNVPWPIVAKTLKSTILEVRAAIGLPVYDHRPERLVLPWDQPQMDAVSDK